MRVLPLIMVAPNGARRTPADHAALPVKIDETVATAKACFAAGAGALHAHVRDADGNHVLDAGLYRELIAKMHARVPGMLVQITTEAVGRYTPHEQRQLVRDVQPDAVSVALREMLPDEGELQASREFYQWAHDADVAVQHILYEPSEVDRLFRLIDQGVIPPTGLQLLFVLGRYTKGQQSSVTDIDPFVAALDTAAPDEPVDWALCAFGVAETDCLVAAVERGGKARIGFENSLWNRDGSLATDNAERVHELKSLIG